MNLPSSSWYVFGECKYIWNYSDWRVFAYLVMALLGWHLAYYDFNASMHRSMVLKAEILLSFKLTPWGQSWVRRNMGVHKPNSCLIKCLIYSLFSLLQESTSSPSYSHFISTYICNHKFLLYKSDGWGLNSSVVLALFLWWICFLDFWCKICLKHADHSLPMNLCLPEILVENGIIFLFLSIDIEDRELYM